MERVHIKTFRWSEYKKKRIDVYKERLEECVRRNLGILGDSKRDSEKRTIVFSYLNPGFVAIQAVPSLYAELPKINNIYWAFKFSH